MTALTRGLKRRIASASSSVTLGLFRNSCSSSWLVVTGCRCTWNESAPTSDTMMLLTLVFMPWMSDTTAMIEVTAMMLPSSVMNDRSLFAQIALNAMPTASMNWVIGDWTDAGRVESLAARRAPCLANPGSRV